MARSVTTFLMFEGVAEEAMNFYVSVFKGSEIQRLERFGPGEQGAEGSIKGAFLTLADTAARSVWAPLQVPVGVVTALLGVPLVLILLARRP